MESEIEFEFNFEDESGQLRYSQVSPLVKANERTNRLYLTKPVVGKIPKKISITINILE